MERLNPKKAALSSGLLSVIIYMVAFIIMVAFGVERFVDFLNIVFFGLDFNNIIQVDILFSITLIGVFVSFAFWMILGYLFATIYNSIN